MIKDPRIPEVVDVEIRGRDIVDRKTGETLVFATNNSAWRTQCGSIKQTLTKKAHQGNSFLVTWTAASELEKGLPAGLVIGKTVVASSNDANIYDDKKQITGLCYDLSFGHNRKKFIHVLDEPAPF